MDEGGGSAPGTDAPNEGNQDPNQGGDQPQGGAPATEYEIDGQKFTADQIREFRKAHEDYGHLQPEYTRASQTLARLRKEGLIDEQGNPVQKEPKAGNDENPFANNPQAKEAVKVLKDLGFITKEEADSMRKEIESFKSNYEQQIADTQLDNVSKALSAKYDGKKGEPKFDLQEIRNAVAKDQSLVRYVQDQNGNYLVDLEQTYRNVHGDFWNNLPDVKAKVLKTERGTQFQSTTPSKTKAAETEEEKINDAVEFFRSNSVEQ